MRPIILVKIILTKIITIFISREKEIKRREDAVRLRESLADMVLVFIVISIIIITIIRLKKFSPPKMQTSEPMNKKKDSI